MAKSIIKIRAGSIKQPKTSISKPKVYSSKLGGLKGYLTATKTGSKTIASIKNLNGDNYTG